MEQLSDSDIAALREAAQTLAKDLEATFDDLAGLSDVSFPDVTGDPKTFPRPSPEDQVVARGLAVLREDTVRTAAVLRAVVRVLESELSPSPSSRTLLTFIRQRYVIPFQQAEGRGEAARMPTGRDASAPETRPSSRRPRQRARRKPTS